MIGWYVSFMFTISFTYDHKETSYEENGSYFFFIITQKNSLDFFLYISDFFLLLS